MHKVFDPIDSGNWSWKVALIWNNFIALEADAILNIPIWNGGRDDF
jgi:hypothetical protein